MTKTYIDSSAKRYKDAYATILGKCAPWKRNAIIEDLATKNNSGVLEVFIADVIVEAERDLTIKKALVTENSEVESTEVNCNS